MIILQQTRGLLSSNDQLALDLPFAETKSLTARVGPTPVFTRSSTGTYFGPLVDVADLGVTGWSTVGITNGRAEWTSTTAEVSRDLFYTGTQWKIEIVYPDDFYEYFAAEGSEWRPDQANWSESGPSVTTSSTYGIVRVAINEPRFYHNTTAPNACHGLLIEESRTNTCRQSENFGTTWTNDVGLVAISLNQTTSPSGAMDADKISENTTASNRRISIQTQSFASGTTYTFSCFVKAAEREFVQLRFGSAFGGQFQNFIVGGVNAGTIGSGVGATAAIQAYPNGWYRCSITAVSAATVSSQVTIGPQISSTAAAWSPYIGTIGSGIFVWGAQLEVGPSLTSYIPTTTAPLLRSADVCSITSSTLWNSSEGTLLSKTIIPNGGFECYPANWLNFFGHRRTISNTLSAITRGGGSFDINLGTFVSGSLRVASTHGGNLVSAVANGGSVVSVSGTLVLNPTSLTIGSAGGGGTTYINGPVDSIRYYRKRLPNAKLQALTA